ncbi:MAG: response regulator [Pseudomonadales bacterium]|nr:response regulator [Pseudomonadales bacterium]
MNVILVDDEPLARQELSYLLRDFPDLNIIAEACNITEAADQIETLKPDLVFLDINMPEGDGFDLLERLSFIPAIVFTTAYDQYAIKAFEVSALDYLLKPIDPTRLGQAIDKVISSMSEAFELAEETLEDDRSEHAQHDQKRLTLEEKIFIKDRDRCWLVKVGDIMLLESQGNYTRVSFEEFNPMIKRPLSQLESRLPENQFIRASRKHIVNIRFVETIESTELGQLEMTLKTGENIAMSRRQSQEFKHLKSF